MELFKAEIKINKEQAWTGFFNRMPTKHELISCIGTGSNHLDNVRQLVINVAFPWNGSGYEVKVAGVVIGTIQIAGVNNFFELEDEPQYS